MNSLPVVGGDENSSYFPENNMKKTTVLFFFFCVLGFSTSNAFCEDSPGEKMYGVISLSVANGRMEPSDRAELSTQALLGTPVKILEQKSWYFVETPEGYSSWVSPGSLKRMNKEEFNRWAGVKKIIITAHYGKSYQEADGKSRIVSDLVFGNLLELLGEKEDFYHIAYPDGRKAYIAKDIAAELETWLDRIELTRESLVEKGFTLRGIPYFWGAYSTKALDCSGFVKTVYFMHGVILRRDSYQQVETGTPIEVSEGYDLLQPGDLLFFRRENETGNKYKIRHVAMYIGNLEFLHAGNPVKVNSFDPQAPNYDAHSAKTLIRATRILGNIDTPGITTLRSNPMYKPQP